MNREKIGSQYHRSGYGRSAVRKSGIYLIEGYAYAKDKTTSEADYNPLTGNLKGYVRVNHSNNLFYQVSDHSITDKHKLFKK